MVSPDPLISYHDNFLDILDKIENTLGDWQKRSLTLIGKITIINTLINTLLYHKLIALPDPPPVFFKIYKEIITRFLWNNKTPRMAYSKLVHKSDKLGLKLVDLYTKMIALKATWPIKWLNNPHNTTWFYTSLPISDDRIWECNICPKDIDKLTCPEPITTAFSIWRSWAQYHYREVDNYEEILLNKLWGNSNIRLSNKPIFDKTLLNSMVDSVLDIIHPMEKVSYISRNIKPIWGRFLFSVLRINYLSNSQIMETYYKKQPTSS